MAVLSENHEVLVESEAREMINGKITLRSDAHFEKLACSYVPKTPGTYKVHITLDGKVCEEMCL